MSELQMQVPTLPSLKHRLNTGVCLCLRQYINIIILISHLPNLNFHEVFPISALVLQKFKIFQHNSFSLTENAGLILQ